MTESTTDKWAQPQKVSEAHLAFSAVADDDKEFDNE